MKKILGRQEFEELRLSKAAEMAADKTLAKSALDVLSKADQYMWIHQSNWFGEPILNVAQDIMASQEIIFNTKPKYIVEVGVAWAGSLLFYSTLMEVLGGEKIIAIDIFIPDDLKARINEHEKLAERVVWIEGSSTDPETIKKVRAVIGDSSEVMVHLDSDHTHDHVLKELHLYGELVGTGHYLICGDTIVELLDEANGRERAWGPGNNPMSALEEYLGSGANFQRDEQIENKLLFTCQPKGYLVKRDV